MKHNFCGIWIVILLPFIFTPFESVNEIAGNGSLKQSIIVYSNSNLTSPNFFPNLYSSTKTDETKTPGKRFEFIFGVTVISPVLESIVNGGVPVIWSALSKPDNHVTGEYGADCGLPRFVGVGWSVFPANGVTSE